MCVSVISFLGAKLHSPVLVFADQRLEESPKISIARRLVAVWHVACAIAHTHTLVPLFICQCGWARARFTRAYDSLIPMYPARSYSEIFRGHELCGFAVRSSVRFMTLVIKERRVFVAEEKRFLRAVIITGLLLILWIASVYNLQISRALIRPTIILFKRTTAKPHSRSC